MTGKEYRHTVGRHRRSHQPRGLGCHAVRLVCLADHLPEDLLPVASQLDAKVSPNSA